MVPIAVDACCPFYVFRHTTYPARFDPVVDSELLSKAEQEVGTVLLRDTERQAIKALFLTQSTRVLLLP